jgi:raffinose/stachyose/melibiose transport system permease protein
MKMNKVFMRVVQNAVAWVVTLIVLIPMVVIFLGSFKSKAESYTLTLDLPKKFIFENYSVVIERGKLLGSFINSFTYASFSTVMIVVLSTLAAFVFARNKSKLNSFMYYFIVLGIAMPVNYISLMKVMQITHLNNTRIGIILLYTAFALPISIFIAYGFIDTIPRELDEAAIIDGCNPISLYFKVIFPLLTPVLATLFVLNFMSTWNDFIMSIYFLNQSSKWPMTLAVYNFFGQFSTQWNYVCADIVLTSIPVLIIFIVGQKYIVSGMTSGSVKG